MTAYDLLEPAGTGPLWGMASRDLNATLLAWPPGHEIEEHTNTGQALLVEKGSTRTFRAGDDGLRYLSVHSRRPPLQVAPLSTSALGA